MITLGSADSVARGYFGVSDDTTTFCDIMKRDEGLSKFLLFILRFF